MKQTQDSIFKEFYLKNSMHVFGPQLSVTDVLRGLQMDYENNPYCIRTHR